MTEVSNNEIRLLKGQDLSNAQLRTVTRCLIGISMIFYITLVVTVLAIIDVNKQQTAIDNQAQIIIHLTSQLIDTELSMNEMRSDYKMLDELHKVSKENR